MQSITVKITDKYKIEGESKVEGHENEIDLTGLSVDLAMQLVKDKSSNSRTTGRAEIGEFECTSYINKAFPKLQQACVNGTNLGEVVITNTKIVEGKISPILQYILSDVVVSSVEYDSNNKKRSYDQANSDEAPVSAILFKLNAKNFKTTYHHYDSTGENKGSVSSDSLTGLGM